MIRTAFLIFASIVFAACIPLTSGVDGTATQEALNNAATQTAAALTTPTVTTPTTTSPTASIVTPTGTGETPVPAATVSATVTQPPQGRAQLLALISNGQLLVTDVTSGVQGGTTQYTVAGQSDQVTDLVWSPSGEFVAFVSVALGAPHIFYTFAIGQGSPTDLGPGSAPAWSPDSRSIAYIGGAFPDENIWITTIDNPSPRQLTFQSNFAWGRPAFTPDGSSLVVTGTSRDNMGASGNTNFILESLALDGSGTRTPLPGTTAFEGARLPYDLRFSTDGTRLAFSTSYHLDACASPGAYYVSNPDGSNRQEFVSPSLRSAIDPNQEHYHVGLSYAWSPASNALLALGNVLDCNLNSPNAGQSIAGPQISIIGLDGSERTVIPGFFYGLSMDRTGTLIAAAHYEDGIQDVDPTVEIYSAETGQLLFPLGAGSSPQFQP
jgi:dipeptidyl aminopeptidase/acylaminoacyl peptidase